eukprot:1570690-Rhodomonas_salina.1
MARPALTNWKSPVHAHARECFSARDGYRSHVMQKSDPDMVHREEEEAWTWDTWDARLYEMQTGESKRCSGLCWWLLWDGDAVFC